MVMSNSAECRTFTPCVEGSRVGEKQLLQRFGNRQSAAFANRGSPIPSAKALRPQSGEPWASSCADSRGCRHPARSGLSANTAPLVEWRGLAIDRSVNGLGAGESGGTRDTPKGGSHRHRIERLDSLPTAHRGQSESPINTVASRAGHSTC